MVDVAAAIAPRPVRPRLRSADLATLVAVSAAVLPARPAAMVGERARLLASARQSRPRSAAHDRQAGRAAADGRHLPDPAAGIAALHRRAARRARGGAFPPGWSLPLRAPPGKNPRAHATRP